MSIKLLLRNPGLAIHYLGAGLLGIWLATTAINLIWPRGDESRPSIDKQSAIKNIILNEEIKSSHPNQKDIKQLKNSFYYASNWQPPQL